VLKPSDRTPISASILGDILSRSGLPEGAFSILPCVTENAKFLSQDERIKLLSFTGSAAVGISQVFRVVIFPGWKLKSESGKKKVTLELGGNAGALLVKIKSDGGSLYC
jgi:acyl-CoA reductase-like NAD-dependent aldehyde dehydrogenase